jgi:hypothetical protein
MPGFVPDRQWSRCEECGGVDAASIGMVHHRAECSQNPDGDPGQTAIPLERHKPESVRRRDRIAPSALARLRELRTVSR